MNALTKKDHTKTGLYTYLVKASYSMHTRLYALCCVAQLDRSGKENELSLKENLKAIIKFISYEYSDSHIDLESDYKDHFCTYEVNKEGCMIMGTLEKIPNDAH